MKYSLSLLILYLSTYFLFKHAIKRAVIRYQMLTLLGITRHIELLVHFITVHFLIANFPVNSPNLPAPNYICFEMH